jgi:hypothetical protein
MAQFSWAEWLESVRKVTTRLALALTNVNLITGMECCRLDEYFRQGIRFKVEVRGTHK